MDSRISEVDPDGLREFSVVFTDRSLNHMSKTFQEVMRDLSGLLREVYGAEAAVMEGLESAILAHLGIADPFAH